MEIVFWTVLGFVLVLFGVFWGGLRVGWAKYCLLGCFLGVGAGIFQERLQYRSFDGISWKPRVAYDFVFFIHFNGF